MKRTLTQNEATRASARFTSLPDDRYCGLSVLDHYVLAMLPGFIAKGGGISENSVAYLIRKAKLLAVRVEDSKFQDPTPDVGWLDSGEDVLDGNT